MILRRCLKIFLPQLIGIIALTVLGIILLPSTIHFARIDFALSGLLTCASTFSGFLLSAVSILYGFSRSVLLQYLNKKGGMKELIVICTVALITGIILIIMSIVYGCILDESQIIRKIWVIGIGDMTILFFTNLVMSGYYLLKTISLASKRIVFEDEDKTKPKGEYRI